MLFFWYLQLVLKQIVGNILVFPNMEQLVDTQMLVSTVGKIHDSRRLVVTTLLYTCFPVNCCKLEIQ